MTVFPDVPPAPGVPPLNRFPGRTFFDVAILTADAFVIAKLFLGPQWGIFDQARQPVIVGDSIKAFAFVGESRIPHYPIEQGGFQSYNKVATPLRVKLTFTKGGSVDAKASFLASIAAAKESLYLFWAVTPEVTYRNVNVVHYDYDRTRASGAGLLTVDVWCEEVRVAPALQFTNVSTKTPDAAGAVNDGTVQPSANSQVTGSIVAKAGSPLAQQLDANPGAFSADGNTFGPVMTNTESGSIVAQRGSPLANQLDSNSGAFSSGGYTFGPAITPNPTSQIVAPHGSPLANQLDATPGGFSAGGYTFGPVQ